MVYGEYSPNRALFHSRPAPRFYKGFLLLRFHSWTFVIADATQAKAHPCHISLTPHTPYLKVFCEGWVTEYSGLAAHNANLRKSEFHLQIAIAD